MIAVYRNYPDFGDGYCPTYEESDFTIADVDFTASCWGNGVLSYYSIDRDSFVSNIGSLLCLILLFRFLSYCFLLRSAVLLGKVK